MLTIVGQLLALFSKSLELYFDPKRVEARKERKADDSLQDFTKALDAGNADFINAYLVDRHNRVRASVRGC